MKFISYYTKLPKNDAVKVVKRSYKYLFIHSIPSNPHELFRAVNISLHTVSRSWMLANQFNTCGNTGKLVKQVWKSFGSFLIYVLDLSLVNKFYYYSQEFKFNIYWNTRLRSMYWLFDWLASWYSFLFYVKCERVPKKYRKKLKKNFIFKYVYLIPRKRERFFYRQLKNYIFSFQGLGFKGKLYSGLLDVALNLKTSNLYKRKINLYKSFLKF